MKKDDFESCLLGVLGHWGWGISCYFTTIVNCTEKVLFIFSSISFFFVLPTTSPVISLSSSSSPVPDTFLYLLKDVDRDTAFLHSSEAPPLSPFLGSYLLLGSPSETPVYWWIAWWVCGPWPCQFPSNLRLIHLSLLTLISRDSSVAISWKQPISFHAYLCSNCPSLQYQKLENQGSMWWPTLIILAFSRLRQEDYEWLWARPAIWVIKLDHVSKQTKAQDTKPGLLPLFEIPAQTASQIPKLFLASSKPPHPGHHKAISPSRCLK